MLLFIRNKYMWKFVLEWEFITVGLWVNLEQELFHSGQHEVIEVKKFSVARKRHIVPWNNLKDWNLLAHYWLLRSSLKTLAWLLFIILCGLGTLQSTENTLLLNLKSIWWCSQSSATSFPDDPPKRASCMYSTDFKFFTVFLSGFKFHLVFHIALQQTGLSHLDCDAVCGWA